IAFYRHLEIKQTVSRESVQHMVKKRDSRIDLILSLPVKINAQGDIRFLSLPRYLSDSFSHIISTSELVFHLFCFIPGKRPFLHSFLRTRQSFSIKTHADGIGMCSEMLRFSEFFDVRMN